MKNLWILDFWWDTKSLKMSLWDCDEHFFFFFYILWMKWLILKSRPGYSGQSRDPDVSKASTVSRVIEQNKISCQLFWWSIKHFGHFPRKKISNICKFQLLKCGTLRLLIVIYGSKWRIFGSWTEEIWRCQFGLVMSI